MKVILSRKGFDSSNGGCPSPIFPDGTLLSLPIPSDDKLTYADITAYQGLSYEQILKQLNPKGNFHGCHLDPDLRSEIRLSIPANWQPAFGQAGSAQGLLRNNGVGEDDLFLFFGWFKQVQQIDGVLSYVPNSPNLHVLWGYLQVERVLKNPDEIEKFDWHPHADSNKYINQNNALYTARKTLSFDSSKPGSSVLNYSENRVLTLENGPMATWRKIPALMPDNIVPDRSNNASGQGIYYQGIWQELVLKENQTSSNWAMSVLQ